MIGALAGDYIAELVLHIISKVRRVGNVYSPLRGRNFQFARFRCLRVSLTNHARLRHRFQHLIAPRARSLLIVIWIVAIRAANQAGKKRGLFEIQRRNIFVEVRARCFSKSVY